MSARHLIVGSGIAGLSAAEAIREEDPGARITMVSAEPHPFCSRPGPAYFLDRSLPLDRLRIRTEEEGERPVADLGRRGARPLPPHRRRREDPGRLAGGAGVERAGFPRGTRRGAVGVSRRHALALVHHGGGSARALWALADEIRKGVRQRFGVRLEVQPEAVGASGRAIREGASPIR